MALTVSFLFGCQTTSASMPSALIRTLGAGLTCGVALPVVEAVPREEDFYDFEARYEIGATRFVCPAALEPEVTARAQELALVARALELAALDVRGHGGQKVSGNIVDIVIADVSGKGAEGYRDQHRPDGWIMAG